MSVGFQLSSDNQNVISINDESFDVGIDYQIRLKERLICEIHLFDIDDVSFCDNLAKLTFVLPCISSGEYIIQIIDKVSSEVKYELTAKVY